MRPVSQVRKGPSGREGENDLLAKAQVSHFTDCLTQLMSMFPGLFTFKAD